MASELVHSGLNEAWVDGLSPALLRHHYESFISDRSTRLREQLHIQVAAAAVTADGGKMAKAQDASLLDASSRRTVGDTPVSAGGQDVDGDAIVRSNDETAHLWTR